MKQLTLSLLALTLSLAGQAENVFVNTPKTTLMLSVDEGHAPRIAYYGARLRPEEARQVYDAGALGGEAYPAFGRNSFGETALSVTHADGNMTTELAATGWRRESDVTIVSLKDRKYNFYVDLCYRSNDRSDVIETWTELRNGEKKPVRMEQYASGVMPIRQEGAWLTHFHGDWGHEAEMTEDLLDGQLPPEHRDARQTPSHLAGRHRRSAHDLHAEERRELHHPHPGADLQPGG